MDAVALQAAVEAVATDFLKKHGRLSQEKLSSDESGAPFSSTQTISPGQRRVSDYFLPISQMSSPADVGNLLEDRSSGILGREIPPSQSASRQISFENTRKHVYVSESSDKVSVREIGSLPDDWNNKAKKDTRRQSRKDSFFPTTFRGAVAGAANAVKRLSIATPRPKLVRNKTAPTVPSDRRPSRKLSVPTFKDNLRKLRGSVPTLSLSRNTEERMRKASKRGLSISVPYPAYASGAPPSTEPPPSGPRMTNFSLKKRSRKAPKRPSRSDNGTNPFSVDAESPLPDRDIGPGYSSVLPEPAPGPPSPTHRVRRRESEDSIAIGPAEERRSAAPRRFRMLEELSPGLAPPVEALRQQFAFGEEVLLPPSLRFPLSEPSTRARL